MGTAPFFLGGGGHATKINIFPINYVEETGDNNTRRGKCNRGFLYAYKVLRNQCSPQNRYDYWHDKLTGTQDTKGDKIHVNNFCCTLDTRLRSFYFTSFS